MLLSIDHDHIFVTTRLEISNVFLQIGHVKFRTTPTSMDMQFQCFLQQVLNCVVEHVKPLQSTAAQGTTAVWDSHTIRCTATVPCIQKFTTQHLIIIQQLSLATRQVIQLHVNIYL